MAIRAKVKCIIREARECGSYRDGKYVPSEVSDDGKCQRTFTFAAVYSDDPKSENKAFWDATPAFDLKMTINNANADFEVGREYYLDFVRAPRPGEAA